MAIRIIDQGFASTGPLLATQKPFVSSGACFYVDSVTGNDANAGTNPALPKATVFGASGAYSVATTGASDLIVCASTHRETISSAQTWSKNGVILWTLGLGASRAQFTSAVAGVAITVSGNNNLLRYLYWTASTAATTSRITLSGTGNEVYGNDFLVGTNDNSDQVLMTGSNNWIRSSTFTVSGTATGTTRRGVRLNGTTTGNVLEDLTFDGSTFGWSDAALKLDDANSDNWRAERITLSNRSFLQITASGLKGYVSGITSDTTSGLSYTE